MSRPKVVAVIPNYNGLVHLAGCLGSLSGADYPHLETILVDNASTDGSPKFVREHFPAVEVLESGSNLGFAAAVNRGISRSLDRGADMIFLFNNDAVLEPGALDSLVRALSNRGRTGSASPKIYFGHQPDRLWYAGGDIDPRTLEPLHPGWDEPDDGRYDTERAVAWATGCALLIRAEAIRSVGLLDESYYLYLEDVEWCLRAAGLGWQCRYVPSARALHFSESHVSNNARYYSLRNHFFLVRRHGSGPQRTFAAARLLARTGKIAARSLFWPGYSRTDIYRVWRAAHLDALLDRRGPVSSPLPQGAWAPNYPDQFAPVSLPDGEGLPGEAVVPPSKLTERVGR